ncbi:MAG: hypothetical protein JHC31_11085 [Sulfurihydrogenibium sp.]|nr:hypothetical protein [Sulfurihydrogenibium sp.]
MIIYDSCISVSEGMHVRVMKDWIDCTSLGIYGTYGDSVNVIHCQEKALVENGFPDECKDDIVKVIEMNAKGDPRSYGIVFRDGYFYFIVDKNSSANILREKISGPVDVFGISDGVVVRAESASSIHLGGFQGYDYTIDNLYLSKNGLKEEDFIRLYIQMEFIDEYKVRFNITSEYKNASYTEAFVREIMDIEEILDITGEYIGDLSLEEQEEAVNLGSISITHPHSPYDINMKIIHYTETEKE